MITVKFTINGKHYKVDFRETDNILDSACYTPQLPFDRQSNGYMFELLTNGLYEGNAKVGDDYSMVAYKLLERNEEVTGITWAHMWDSGEDKPFNAEVVMRLELDIHSVTDDDLSKIDGVQLYHYGCDAGSMVVSSGGFRTYFGNNCGDGEFPIYYVPESGLVDRDYIRNNFNMVGMFELIEDADGAPISAAIESYDCKFMGIEKELTRAGRYAVSCSREGGTMLIERWDS